MESITTVFEKIKRKPVNQDYKDFVSHFSEGYLELEFLEKQKQLNEYINAFNELEDKESFHAQYLSSLIDFIKSEI